MLSCILTVRAEGIFGSSTISPPRVFILKIKIESSQLMQLNFSDISSLFSMSSIIISFFEHEIEKSPCGFCSSKENIELH